MCRAKRSSVQSRHDGLGALTQLTYIHVTKRNGLEIQDVAVAHFMDENSDLIKYEVFCEKFQFVCTTKSYKDSVI